MSTEIDKTTKDLLHRVLIEEPDEGHFLLAIKEAPPYTSTRQIFKILGVKKHSANSLLSSLIKQGIITEKWRQGNGQSYQYPSLTERGKQIIKFMDTAVADEIERRAKTLAPGIDKITEDNVEKYYEIMDHALHELGMSQKEVNVLFCHDVFNGKIDINNTELIVKGLKAMKEVSIQRYVGMGINPPLEVLNYDPYQGAKSFQKSFEEFKDKIERKDLIRVRMTGEITKEVADVLVKIKKDVNYKPTAEETNRVGMLISRELTRQKYKPTELQDKEIEFDFPTHNLAMTIEKGGYKVETVKAPALAFETVKVSDNAKIEKVTENSIEVSAPFLPPAAMPKFEAVRLKKKDFLDAMKRAPDLADAHGVDTSKVMDSLIKQGKGDKVALPMSRTPMTEGDPAEMQVLDDDNNVIDTLPFVVKDGVIHPTPDALKRIDMLESKQGTRFVVTEEQPEQPLSSMEEQKYLDAHGGSQSFVEDVRLAASRDTPVSRAKIQARVDEAEKVSRDMAAFELRKLAILECMIEGKSVVDIAKELNMNDQQIYKAVNLIQRQAREEMRNFFDEILPMQVKIALERCNAIIKSAMLIANDANAKTKDKLEALSMAQEANMKILSLLTEDKSFLKSISRAADTEEIPQ